MNRLAARVLMAGFLGTGRLSLPAAEPVVLPGLPGDFAKIPLSFEPNVGQAAKEVRFLARGGGYTAFFTDAEFVLVAGRSREVVRLGLRGATPLEIVGEEPLAGRSHYFIGSDPALWHEDVPSFARLRYRGVRPGIDVVLYGNRSSLEYDVVVSPGADPRGIEFEMEGAQNARVDGRGDLSLELRSGALKFARPVAYQARAGVDGGPAGSHATGERDSISSRYNLRGRRLSFRVGAYDRTRPLVIDPSLVFSSYFGSGDFDRLNTLAVGSDAQVYVAGTTYSTDFPVRNPVQSTFGGSQDVFVSKISSDGRSVVYSTYLGGRVPGPATNPSLPSDCCEEDDGRAIAVDPAGNAYVVGTTSTVDFPTRNAFRATLPGFSSGFVTKLTPAGLLSYSTYLGGSDTANAQAVAVDSSGSAYVAGRTSSGDFPLRNPFQTAHPGPWTAFLTKLSPDGGSLEYSTYFGPIVGGPFLGGAVGGIGVDSAGRAVLVGTTDSAHFPVFRPLQSQLRGSTNAFIAKFAADGASLVYSTYLGGNYDSSGAAVAVDAAGSAFVVGSTDSTDFPTVNAFQAVRGAVMADDAFVAKLSPDGAKLVYATYLGGSNPDRAWSVAVDGNGRAFVLGETQSGDFPLKSPLRSRLFPSTDLFLTVFSADGRSLVSSGYFGGSDSEWGPSSVGLDGRPCRVTLAGSTSSTDFPVKGAALPSGPPRPLRQTGFVSRLSIASLTPSASEIIFGPQIAGLAAPPQSITITNTGDAPENAILSLSGAPDFAFGTSCLGTLAPGASCQVILLFTARAYGPRSATLTIDDGSCPQTIPLGGIGVHSDPICPPPLACRVPTAFSKGVIQVLCDRRPCRIADSVPMNCQTKWIDQCPWCTGAKCPGWYQAFFDVAGDVFNIVVVDSNGKPLPQERAKTPTGVVVSFQPSTESHVDGQIGNFFFLFDLGPNGKVGTPYKVSTHLRTGDGPYRP